MDELVKLIQGTNLIDLVKIWALVMARVQMIILLVPGFGGKPVPMRVKMALAIALSVFMFPLVRAQLPGGVIPADAGPFALLILKEVFVGYTIGFVAALIYHAAMMGGRLVDLARGASMGNMLDPMLGQQASHLGLLEFQLILQLVFWTNLHLVFLNGFLTSFELLPVTQYATFGTAATSPVLEAILRHTAYIWVVAIQLNMPVFIIVFFTDMIMGILNRISPQIKVTFMAAPAKMLAGVWVTMIALAAILSEMEAYVVESSKQGYTFLRLLGAAP